MFEFSDSKDIYKLRNDKRRIPTSLLAYLNCQRIKNYLTYLLALIVKELKISVEQGRVVTTLHTIKH